MAAPEKVLRAARQDIARFLKHDDLAAVVLAYLKVPVGLRGEFSTLPATLGVQVRALHARRLWVPLHALASKVERNPELVADASGWWSLLLASAVQQDLPRAQRIWARLRDAVHPEGHRRAIEAWLSGATSPEALEALEALLPPFDPRLGEEPIGPRLAAEPPKVPAEAVTAALQAFATQGFSSVAMTVQRWVQRATPEVVAALWEVGVPLGLREMLRRLADRTLGDPKTPLLFALQGLEARPTPDMAPHRALVTRYAMAALGGKLPGISPPDAVTALRVPLADPELRAQILEALEGVELKALSDPEARAVGIALVKHAPRGAVLGVVLVRLAKLPAVPEITELATPIVRDDAAGFVRWAVAANPNDRRTALEVLRSILQVDEFIGLLETVWTGLGADDRERLTGLVLGLFRRFTHKMRFVPSATTLARMQAAGLSRHRLETIMHDLYRELEEALPDHLSCDVIEAIIDDFSPPPSDLNLWDLWEDLADQAHQDYHAAEQDTSLQLPTDARLQRLATEGAIYDPNLLGLCMQTLDRVDAIPLALAHARRRKGLAPWIDVTTRCDANGAKVASDVVLAEGLARFGGDFGTLCATWQQASFQLLAPRHQQRFAEALVAAAGLRGGDVLSPGEHRALRWGRNRLAKAKPKAPRAEKKPAAKKPAAKRGTKAGR